MQKRLITIIILSLLFCLKGCIIVEPQVLDFGSETDTLRLYIEPALRSSWKVESGESWLTTYPTSGTTSRSIYVYVERSGLEAGTYTGELQVRGEDSGSGLPPSSRVRVGMEVLEGWNGDIEGYIYDEDTGEGIEGAVVQIHKGSGLLFETQTESTGYYEFNLIAAQGKQYRLYISKEGYFGRSEFVEPIGGTVVQKDIYLKVYEPTDTTTSSTTPSSTTTTIDDLPGSTTTTISEGSTSTTTSVFIIPLRRLQ